LTNGLHLHEFVSNNSNLNIGGAGTYINTYVGSSLTGSLATGQHVAFQAQIDQTGATPNLGAFVLGAVVQATANSNAGGTLGSENSNVMGANVIAKIKAGATYFTSAVGLEVDVAALEQPLDKIGLSVVGWTQDAYSGSRSDAMIAMVRNPSSLIGFNYGMVFGAPWGWWPIKSTGTLIGAPYTPVASLLPAPAKEAAWGIDFSGVAFSGGFLKSTGFTVDGTGAVSATTGVFSSGLTVGNATARQPFAHGTYINPVAGSMASPAFSVYGNAFGTVTSGPAFFRTFSVNSDTVNTSAASGGGANVNYFGHTISAGAVGGRTTLSVFMSQQGATTSALGQYYVAGACFGEASYSAGGTAGIGNTRGNLFATNHSVRLKTGAGLYWNEVVGEEVDIGVQTGTAVAYKVGFKVVQWADDAVRGTVGDYAIGINNQSGGTAPGWTVGFSVGGPEGWWPIASTGTIFGTDAGLGGGPSMAAAYGIDLRAVTFSTAAFASTGFEVDGIGRTTAPAFILTSGGPTITTGAGVPATTTPKGSIYFRTGGAVGSTLYVSQGGGTWNAVAGV
jgi:hypothetical protein